MNGVCHQKPDQFYFNAKLKSKLPQAAVSNHYSNAKSSAKAYSTWMPLFIPWSSPCSGNRILFFTKLLSATLRSSHKLRKDPSKQINYLDWLNFFSTDIGNMNMPTYWGCLHVDIYSPLLPQEPWRTGNAIFSNSDCHF